VEGEDVMFHQELWIYCWLSLFRWLDRIKVWMPFFHVQLQNDACIIGKPIDRDIIQLIDY